MTAKLTAAPSHGNRLLAASVATRWPVAFLSQLLLYSCGVGASKVVQFANEHVPSVVFLKFSSEIGVKMLIGERECETKRIANNDFRFFNCGIPFVMLNGIACCS